MLISQGSQALISLFPRFPSGKRRESGGKFSRDKSVARKKDPRFAATREAARARARRFVSRPVDVTGRCCKPGALSRPSPPSFRPVAPRYLNETRVSDEIASSELVKCCARRCSRRRRRRHRACRNARDVPCTCTRTQIRTYTCVSACVAPRLRSPASQIPDILR